MNAADGKVLWRKTIWEQFFPVFHRFFTDGGRGLCIAQLGGEEKGRIYYALANGDLKWKWTEDGSGYASSSSLA